MNTKNISAITPKLCGGYRIPTSSKDLIAIYHPAINQIWISGSVSEDDLMLMHAHESMHMYTISLQPSQLLLLRAELLGSVDRPGTECFDDIVETVCEACFWAQTRLGIEDIPHMIHDAKYPGVFSALIELSQRIVSNAPENSDRDKVLKEAVVGVCLLLMHVIPHRPGLASELISIIADLPLQESYTRRWLIFQCLYVELDAKWQETSEFRDLFTLVRPRDSHRYVSDMIDLLLGALNIVHYKPETITAVFPVLLLLLTQASFVLLPFVYVKKSGKEYEAEIRLVHSTSQSNEDGCEAASLQQEASMKSKERGVLCGAASVFVSLINESNKYRISDAKDRTYECFGHLLGILPDLLRAHILTKNNCPACCAIFRGDMIESAMETIIDMSQDTREKMIQSAKEYDTFLATGAMDIIQDTWNLGSTPQAFCSYDFL